MAHHYRHWLWGFSISNTLYVLWNINQSLKLFSLTSFYALFLWVLLQMLDITLRRIVIIRWKNSWWMLRKCLTFIPPSLGWLHFYTSNHFFKGRTIPIFGWIFFRVYNFRKGDGVINNLECILDFFRRLFSNNIEVFGLKCHIFSFILGIDMLSACFYLLKFRFTFNFLLVMLSKLVFIHEVYFLWLVTLLLFLLKHIRNLYPWNLFILGPIASLWPVLLQLRNYFT